MTAPWKPPVFATDLGPTELWNAVLALAGQPIPLSGTNTTAVFAPTEKPAPDAWVTELRLRPFAAPLFLHVADFPFRTLFNADLSMADIGGLPDGLRQALCEGVLSTLRAMLPPDLAGRLEAGGSGLASGFPDLSGSEIQAFALRLSGANGLGADLVLASDRSLVTRALPDLSDIASPAGEALASHVASPVDMTLGSITLLRRELASLEPGAVVLLAETPPGTLSVRAGSVVYQFTETGEGWRSAGRQPLARFHPRTTVHIGIGHTGTGHSTNGNDMAEDASPPAESEEPQLADDLRVTIDFDLGRSMVPLSVLAKWQPGALVDLTPPQIAEGVCVTIRANGDAVGTGDIVRVDDRLAVRITRFALRA